MDKNNTDNHKEKVYDKSKVARIGIGAFLVIDFIIFIIFFLLFPRYCSNKSNINSSSLSSYKEPYDGKELNNRLINLVKEQLEYNLFDEDDIKNIISFRYDEDVQGNFKISLTVSSDTNAYLYTASKCQYEIKDDKDNPFNHLNSGDFTITGDVSVSKYKITADSYIGETNNEYNGKTGFFIAYETITNSKYFSGYCFKDNKLNIYQHIEVNDEFTLAKDVDPLKNIKPGVGASVITLNNDHPLYDYYLYLRTI